MSLRSKPTVRYAVVGLGHIAQAAVLPAFENAKQNSELVAFVSDDPVKQQRLGRRYRVNTYTYKEYDALLDGGAIDAVYIALPNSMHRDFTVRAARCGVHVLCEKPLALTERDCQVMIDACALHKVKLMTAYRLHFERANLAAIELVQSGKLGEPRVFNSVFGYQLKPGNIRTQKKLGGGAAYDIGIYCINAARYLFQAEPIEVKAYMLQTDTRRFREVDAITSAMMLFPRNRIATFTCSFDSADVAAYSVFGTKGKLRLEMAYEYAAPITMELSIGEKKQQRTYDTRDQFGAELIYFSDCVLNDKKPEPSGEEGLADVRVIRAIFESARTGRHVKIPPLVKRTRPSRKQEIARPAVPEPELVNTEAPAE
jgi:glucose-fructose oxidoreductase